jgi:hypothetical protein
MQFNAVSENLDISKTCELRKHTKLFAHARILRYHRNRIVHNYGLSDSSLKWDVIWRNVNSKLKYQLLPELNNVIEKHDKSNFVDCEKKSMNSKLDPEDIVNIHDSVETTSVEQSETSESENEQC